MTCDLAPDFLIDTINNGINNFFYINIYLHMPCNINKYIYICTPLIY